MAQVCGGTTFDFVASRKHDAAQRVLSRAADIWAKGGRDALRLDAVVAVLLHIFLSRWSEYDGVSQEARTLEMWLPLVASAQQEADGLMTQLAPASVAGVLSVVFAELSFASDQWSLGDPEQPPTAQALNTVEHILFTHRLTTRPASPKLPTSVRHATNEPNV